MSANANRYAYEKRFALSSFKQGTMLALPTVNGTNFALMRGYSKELMPDFPDIVSSDEDEINGSEVGTELDIPEKRVSFGFSMDRALPNEMVTICGGCLGDITSDQDQSEYNGYRHYIVPVSAGTALPIMGAVFDPANRQESFPGIVATDFEISGDEEGYWKLAGTLQGSGQRTDSSETWMSAITEKLLRMADTKFYIKTSPTPASDYIGRTSISQSSDNISVGQSLTDLGARVKGFSIKYNGNPDLQAGAGGGGYLQGIVFGPRTYDLTLKLRYNDETERDYFENLTKISFEANCKNPDALIDASGAFYYGAIVRVAQAQVSKRPMPTGDKNEIELTFKVQDDGTNPILNVIVFNAQTAYFAAAA